MNESYPNLVYAKDAIWYYNCSLIRMTNYSNLVYASSLVLDLYATTQGTHELIRFAKLLRT